MFLNTLFGFLIPFTVIGLIVFVGYQLYRHKKEAGHAFSGKGYVALYASLVTFASLIMFAYGWTLLNQAGLGMRYGTAFSYRAEWKSCGELRPAKSMEEATAEVVEPCPPIYEYDALAPKRDLVRGISLMIISLLFGVLHLWIVKKLDVSESERWIVDMLVIVAVFFFGAAAIVSLPTGIYSAVNFFLYGMPSPDQYIPDSQIPGQSVGSAIAFTPIWIVILKVFLNKMKSRSSGSK